MYPIALVRSEVTDCVNAHAFFLWNILEGRHFRGRKQKVAWVGWE